MNKDVIYIEPEDDITDIIAKIDNSKEKIVALVPPKKAGILRSIVNIKLIAKAAVKNSKTVVLVTTDPNIMKLAAATKIPVTRNLQSAPVVPGSSGEEVSETVSEDLIEKVAQGDKEVRLEDVKQDDDEKDNDEIDEDDDENEDDDDTTDERTTKKSKRALKAEKKRKLKAEKPRSNNPFIRFLQVHTKLIIFGGIGLIALVVLLVWAFTIAPAVDVVVGIRTVTSNFSENITLTENLTDENIANGKFYLKTEKIDEKNEVVFEATGTRNIGARAKGEVVVYAFFRKEGNLAVNAGATFTISGLNYTSDSDVKLSWNGKDTTACENNGQASAITSGCLISERVAVTATEPGANYNISASLGGWSTTASVSVYSETAISGGTDEMISIVQQSDIEAALAKVKTTSADANKEKLLSSINEGDLAIPASFKQVTGDPAITPKLGEEVKAGEKAKLVVVTTASMFVLDKTKIEEFITEKAKLAQNYKIYNINDPFIENYLQVEGGYAGKLKASYVSGPKVTENDVVEIIRGKGLGVAQHDLKDIDGVSSIRIDVSYPWVMSVPNDPNKITVNFNVEES